MRTGGYPAAHGRSQKQSAERSPEMPRRTGARRGAGEGQFQIALSARVSRSAFF